MTHEEQAARLEKIEQRFDVIAHLIARKVMKRAAVPTALKVEYRRLEIIVSAERELLKQVAA
jgi:hypothetical protein